jgi:hypothetical protein
MPLLLLLLQQAISVSAAQGTQGYDAKVGSRTSLFKASKKVKPE